MATSKKPNWTPYAVGAAICLALGFFFFIDADAARHNAATGRLWSVLAWIFFGLFIASFVLGYVITNSRRKL